MGSFGGSLSGLGASFSTGGGGSLTGSSGKDGGGSGASESHDFIRLTSEGVDMGVSNRSQFESAGWDSVSQNATRSSSSVGIGSSIVEGFVGSSFVKALGGAASAIFGASTAWASTVPIAGVELPANTLALNNTGLLTGENTLARSNKKFVRLYHYGFRKDEPSIRLMGIHRKGIPNADAYASCDYYASGQIANQKLSLSHQTPPDTRYALTVDLNKTIGIPLGPTPPINHPDPRRKRQGGGDQWYFPFGIPPEAIVDTEPLES